MGKKSMALRVWECCRSLGGKKRSHMSLKGGAYSKSVRDNKNGNNKNKSSSNEIIKGEIAPQGWFSVQVGPERQRFIVKTEYINHPLFMVLLEEAEKEFGFEFDGPIRLPCNVDLFYKVLAEMDGKEKKNTVDDAKAKGFSLFLLLSPSRLFCNLNRDHSEYSVMNSEMLRVNQFH